MKHREYPIALKQVAVARVAAGESVAEVARDLKLRGRLSTTDARHPWPVVPNLARDMQLNAKNSGEQRRNSQHFRCFWFGEPPSRRDFRQKREAAG